MCRDVGVQERQTAQRIENEDVRESNTFFDEMCVLFCQFVVLTFQLMNPQFKESN